VPHETELSDVLSEFARTLLTDFPIQGILDHLAKRIVESLPATSVGITLISPGAAPHYIAASDDAAFLFETMQTRFEEGPCMSAYESGHVVEVPDLSKEERFPRYVAAATEAGLAAVFAFPLKHGAGRLGSLDLYRDTPGELDAQDTDAARTLADVTAAYILNAQARDAARKTADHFRTSALHDPLTGLPNRVLLQQRLVQAAERRELEGTSVAVLFADLDRFKHVNDTYGHPVGDDLLVSVANRLSDLVRPGDTLARVSGDEFVFLCQGLMDTADVEVLATRIGAAFTVPFVLPGVELSVTASVGMACTGPGEAVSSQLVVDADIAMYQAKRKGGGTHQVIDLTEAHRINDRNSLEHDLHTAFARGDLDVAYQPVVRSIDGLLVGVEALLRWTHPERGVVPALDMVSIAEDDGLITQIGAWILERSCTDRGQWLRDHPDKPLSLSVNVSVRQLMSPDFASTVSAVLDKTEMDPTALILEITEGILIQDGARAAKVMAELKQLGVRLALDDFGTGYSSLNYLRQFPVDILKIDQVFIATMGHDPSAAAILAAIANLAHALGLSVIAEGVETLEQRREIITLGCEFAQGFLYSAALRTREFASLLQSSGEAALYLLPPDAA
jgi:diguanylate cyclase (GGDEF)-like protein